jgi:hypothetical protein
MKRQGLLLVWVAALLLSSVESMVAKGIDPASVERMEHHSETLANQLHELSISIRDRDLTGVSSHFGTGLLASTWPALGDSSSGISPWFKNLHTPLSTVLARRDTFLASLHRFLDAMESIEDVRLKVKSADFENLSYNADAHVALAIVARSNAGQRIWIQAKAHVLARLPMTNVGLSTDLN